MQLGSGLGICPYCLVDLYEPISDRAHKAFLNKPWSYGRVPLTGSHKTSLSWVTT